METNLHLLGLGATWCIGHIHVYTHLLPYLFTIFAMQAIPVSFTLHSTKHTGLLDPCRCSMLLSNVIHKARLGTTDKSTTQFTTLQDWHGYPRQSWMATSLLLHILLPHFLLLLHGMVHFLNDVIHKCPPDSPFKYGVTPVKQQITDLQVIRYHITPSLLLTLK